MGLQFDTSSGKMPFGMKMPSCEIKIKGPSMEIELDAELEVEVDASIEIDVDVEVKIKAPSCEVEVQIKGPSMEIELDVEIDVKLKQPIESEAEEYGFKICGGYLEQGHNLKRGKRDTPHYHCSIIEAMQICMANPDEAIGITWNGDKFPTGEVDVFIKNDSCKAEVFPEHPEVLSMAARIQANKENGPIFGRMAPPAHFHAPHPMHYGAPGMHHAPMPMRPPSPPPRDPRAMSPGPVSAAAAGRLQGQHDAAVRYGSPLSSPRGVPAGYGYGAHGHVAGYGGHMHPGAHGYHMQHAGYEMQRDMNTRQLDADVRGLSAAQRIHSHTSYTTQASTTQDK